MWLQTFVQHCVDTLMVTGGSVTDFTVVVDVVIVVVVSPVCFTEV